MPAPAPARGARTICLVLVATAGVLAACQPSVTDPAGETAPASATASDDGADAELPADFPVPPDATRRDASADAPATIASWSADAAGSTVYDFYVEALPATGYPTTELLPGGSVAVIRFRAPAGATWQLVLTGERGGGTLIELEPAQP